MQAARPADGVQAPDSRQRARILLVDDQQALLQSLQALLRVNGYQVELANGGGEAIDKLQQEPFNLVLLDLQMPVIDGRAVQSYINEHALPCDVIVISGESSFSAVKHALRNGAYDFVRKPYGAEELLSSIRNCLESHWQNRSRQQSELSLRESERIHRFMVNRSPDFIYMLDPHGVFTYVNDTVEELLGYKRNELLGQHFASIIHPHNADEIHNYFCEQRAASRDEQHIEVRLQVNRESDRVRCLDNHELIVELKAFGMYDDPKDGARTFLGTLGCARDITARKNTEAQISYQAYHDLLTRLPNRILFDDRISQAFAHARRYQQQFALMFLDLDHFKQINDTLGHAMGDRALQQVSERIQRCLRAEDTLSRFGGDEFSLLLPNISGKENVTAVAEKILDAVRRPFMINQHEVSLSLSIGVALYPLAGESKEALLQSADIAMYHVKATGKDGYCFYSDAMSGTNSNYLQVERDLYLALEKQQFEVFFQPKVDPLSHMIIGMEALVRWRHPERGLVFPGDFIAIAEESKLIVPIGDWVLRSTCEEVARWQAQGIPKLKISLNLSPLQFQAENFVDKFIGTLQEFDLSGDIFEVEIAEQGLVAGNGGIVRKLHALREYGVSVAIDDFGRGYSSLSYLQDFPVNTLKIDRSFVREIAAGQKLTCVVDAIAMMAKGLNLHLVAEGVETQQQLDYLLNLGCSEVQGYFYGAAETAETTFNMLSRRPIDGPHFVLPH